MSERDYVLGTGDREIERLGLQHRVWRGEMLRGWKQAAITLGQTVIDVGAGPGYASVDLAEIVGPDGRVIAVERSARFLEALESNAERHGLGNIETRNLDVVEESFGEAVADAAWCRWVLSFVSNAQRAVQNIARALKPGGVAIFHEYAHYSDWTLLPPSVLHARFVELVVESWIEAGGDPDVALCLPSMLEQAGMEVTHIRPMIHVVQPSDFMWQWPAAFTRVNVERLQELGKIDAVEAASLARVIEKAGADPKSRMITPLVFEVIAKRA